MDTFFEQIVSIRKNALTRLAIIGLWVLAALLTVFLLMVNLLGALTVFAVIGIVYGAYTLTGMTNIEYEYIITNGTMDIDKIINKSSRKRIASFELSQVSRLEKFSSEKIVNIDKKYLVVACNQNDPQAYYMICEREGKGALHVVFAPEERIKGAVLKFVPKFIANNAFKD